MTAKGMLQVTYLLKLFIVIASVIIQYTTAIDTVCPSGFFLSRNIPGPKTCVECPEDCSKEAPVDVVNCTKSCKKKISPTPSTITLSTFGGTSTRNSIIQSSTVNINTTAKSTTIIPYGKGTTATSDSLKKTLILIIIPSIIGLISVISIVVTTLWVFSRKRNTNHGDTNGEEGPNVDAIEMQELPSPRTTASNRPNNLALPMNNESNPSSEPASPQEADQLVFPICPPIPNDSTRETDDDFPYLNPTKKNTSPYSSQNLLDGLDEAQA